MNVRLVSACCLAALAMSLSALTTGCVSDRPAVAPTTQSAAKEDPKTAKPEYWLNQPAVASARAARFDPLWQAGQDVLRDHLFPPDRIDYRLGLLTSRPLISKQVFEPWRSDVGEGLASSTLATHRRTVRIEVTRLPDGTYEAVPKVLIERQSVAGRRITSATEYHDAFKSDKSSGSRERDQGVVLPQDYWYAVGRDHALEKQMAEEMREKL